MRRLALLLLLIVPRVALATYDSEVLTDTPCVFYKLDEATCNNGAAVANSAGNGGHLGTFVNNGATCAQTIGTTSPALTGVKFNHTSFAKQTQDAAAACNAPRSGNGLGWTADWVADVTNSNNGAQLCSYDGPNNHGVWCTNAGNTLGTGAGTYSAQTSCSMTYSPSFYGGAKTGTHHYAVTTVGNGTTLANLKWYVDGVLLETVTSFSCFKAWDNLGLMIGGYDFGAGQGQNDITIGHAALYTTELSAARILVHAQAAGLAPATAAPGRRIFQSRVEHPFTFGPLRYAHAERDLAPP